MKKQTVCDKMAKYAKKLGIEDCVLMCAYDGQVETKVVGSQGFAYMCATLLLIHIMQNSPLRDLTGKK
jgi:hypothetical protein